MTRKSIRIILNSETMNFIESLPEGAREKILYNLNKVSGGFVDKELFKKLDGSEIWEFRTLFNRIKYRIFAFWDTENEALVFTTHGIIKKTKKIPRKDISKAEAAMKDYFEQKKRN